MLRVLLKLCKYYRFYTHQYFGDCFASQHTIFSQLTNQVITNSRMNARLMSFSLSVFHLETLSSFELFVGNAIQLNTILNSVLKRRYLKLFIEYPNTIFNQLRRIKINLINRFAIDFVPKLLKLLLIKISIQRIVFRFTIITNTWQLRFTINTVNQGQYLLAVRL